MHLLVLAWQRAEVAGMMGGSEWAVNPRVENKTIKACLCERGAHLVIAMVVYISLF